MNTKTGKKLNNNLSFFKGILMSEFVVWSMSTYSRGRPKLNGAVVAVQKFRVQISPIFIAFFCAYAEFYVDASSKTIAVKPVADCTANSFLAERDKVRKNKLRFGVKRLADSLKIKSGVYPAYWDDAQKWLVFTYETLDAP